MPRRKKVNSEDIKGFENTEETLIVNLPIKVKNDKKSTLESELIQLKKENKELKEKISNMMLDNLKKVTVIKNNTNCNNIKCWWCDGHSDNSIILPDKKIKDSFYGLGSFCSFNCALSYNFEKRDEKVWERCSLLYQLKDKINDPDMNEKIIPAPPKEILKEFGGELTREEYNQLLISIDYSFVKLLPPMVSSTIMIEQRNKNTPEISQLNILGLKLKRTTNPNPAKNKFSLDNLISV